MNKHTTICIALILNFIASSMRANPSSAGSITFYGGWTPNGGILAGPEYAGIPAQPFDPNAGAGSMGAMTVQSVTGLFATFVNVGDALSMSTPYLYTYITGSPYVTPYAPNGSPYLEGRAMAWSIDGFNFATPGGVLASGDQFWQDSSLIYHAVPSIFFYVGGGGSQGYGYSHYPVFTGNGVNFATITDFYGNPTALSENWVFQSLAPFSAASLTVNLQFDDGVVPETGDSLALLLIALLALLAVQAAMASGTARISAY